MPFISVNTAQTLSKTSKENIKTKLGEKISLIPNKREEVLMIQFIDGVTSYFAGKENPNAVYVDVKCYKQASFEENKKFTEAVNIIMQEEININSSDLYLTITEFSTWGMKGSLRS